MQGSATSYLGVGYKDQKEFKSFYTQMGNPKRIKIEQNGKWKNIKDWSWS
jgi:hypothetical protein